MSTNQAKKPKYYAQRRDSLHEPAEYAVGIHDEIMSGSESGVSRSSSQATLDAGAADLNAEFRDFEENMNICASNDMINMEEMQFENQYNRCPQSATVRPKEELTRFQELLVSVGLASFKEGKFTVNINHSSLISKLPSWRYCGEKCSQIKALVADGIARVLSGGKFNELRQQYEVDGSRLCLGIALGFLALFVLFIQLYIVMMSKSSDQIVYMNQTCNIYGYPGYLDSRTLRWRPYTQLYNSNCPIYNDFDSLAYLKDESRQLPKFLANKLIVLIGDSQDRDAVKTLCHAIPDAKLHHIGFDGKFKNASSTDSLRSLGTSRVCLVQRLSSAADTGKKQTQTFAVLSLFQFGVSLRSRADKHIMEHLEEGDPLATRERLSRLPGMVAAVSKKMGRAVTFPDVMVVHSSLWDLMTWERMGHTDEDVWAKIDGWPEVARLSLVRPLQDMFPSSRLWLRNTPVLPSSDASSQAFPSYQIAAMNEAARCLARNADLNFIDWKRTLETLPTVFSADNVHVSSEAHLALFQIIWESMR